MTLGFFLAVCSARGDVVVNVNAVEAERDAGVGLVTALAAAGLVDAQVAGRGGSGVVFRCTQATLGRIVAAKVLTRWLADDQARFAREQRAMGQLTGHPHIVAVLAVGELGGGLPYVLMPFCGRGSVEQRIARLGLLPLDEVLRVGVKMAAALAAAHRLGLVHRGVKPSNILLTDYGEPALCDFGVARVAGEFKSAAGVDVGPPAFTAPELIAGKAPCAATDVYGLGATLVAAMTGHRVFERLRGEETAQFARTSADPMLTPGQHTVPDDLAAVLNAATSHDPSQRPSALQLGEQLQRVQANHGLHVDELVLHDEFRRPVNVSSAPRTSPTSAPAAGYLPAPVSGFVGRGGELADVVRLVASSRLVSVTGVGGIGKTTLAAHAARQLKPDFPDGVWLVELAELRDGALLVDSVAGALGIRDQPGRSRLDVLVGFLSECRVLLVLDNCEHLVDDVANLAGNLLRCCPQLHILATSREVLGIGGEAVVALSPLAVPDPDGDPTLRSLAACAAVALFVQRASAALPGFALTEANAAAVASVCTRLEGLPLALELAAARVRALSVEQIAKGLSDRFTLLTRGKRGAPGRQHTLAGCIEWSYQLCTTTEQDMWARLSVFAGSFDLAAAHHVCGGSLSSEQCLDVLSVLVDKSILIRADQGAATRYRLLDTVREYGSARLSSTEFDPVHRRHADWYQRLLAQGWAEWFGPRQEHWLHRLTIELPNIREALQFRLKECPTVALQMAADARRFWFFRGMLTEARRWLDLSLSAIGTEPTQLRIRGLYEAAGTATLQGDLAVAHARVAEARTLLTVVDDSRSSGLIDAVDAQLAMFSADLEHARACSQRALETSDDYEIRAMMMFFMGRVLDFSGAHDAAMSWHDKMLALTNARGDRYHRSWAQFSLSLGLWGNGESERAVEPVRQALDTWSVLNQTWASSYCLEVLAWIAGAHHDPRRAVVLMAAASALSRATGSVSLPFPQMKTWHDECEGTARSVLNASEFEAAWAEGSAFSLEGAAAYALAGS